MQEKMKKNTENRRKRAKKEIARGKKNPRGTRRRRRENAPAEVARTGQREGGTGMACRGKEESKSRGSITTTFTTAFNIAHY